MINGFYKGFILLLGLALLFAMGSCNNRSIMFRAKHNYQYSDVNDLKVVSEYRIGVNDEVSIVVSANNGASLIESANIQEQRQIKIIVDFDGTLKIPLIGRIPVIGLTINEAELLLEEQYRRFLVDPFVKVDVLNKRVVMFTGMGGTARVINLQNKNTTLIEAIAQTGGVNQSGKSHRIKIFRKSGNGELKIYKVDLSKIQYVNDSQIILQSNDVVYIEPRNDLLLNFVERSSGFLFLFNIYLLVNALGLLN